MTEGLPLVCPRCDATNQPGASATIEPVIGKPGRLVCNCCTYEWMPTGPLKG